LNSIGLVLFKIELHELAMQSFHESLRIRQRLLGPDHRGVAIILYNIATIHLEIGDDDEAMVYYRETLCVERCVLGRCHKEVVLTMQHIGQVHQQRGEFGEAAKHNQTELEVNYDTRFFAHQKEANPGKLVFNAIGYLFDHGEYCVF
jgi:tetratricopeptide (TPR) repeat protein